MTTLSQRLKTGSGEEKTRRFLLELADHGLWQGWGYLGAYHSRWTARWARWRGLVEQAKFYHEGPFYRITQKGRDLLAAKEPRP
jgi:hypothetical protein